METAQIPLCYNLAIRRILHLKIIHHRDPEELIGKVVEAQKSDPTRGCQIINLELTEEEIRGKNRYELRIYTKMKAREATITELQNIKAKKSKMNGFEFIGLSDLQEYLQSLPTSCTTDSYHSCLL